jgi:inhibitor of KinA
VITLSNNLTLDPDPSGFVIKPAGDAALVVEMGETVDPLINQRVHALARQLDANLLAGIVGITPTYRSLLVRYDPLVLSYGDVTVWVNETSVGLDWDKAVATRLVKVPVQYGGTGGFDLEHVAKTCGLSVGEVICLHSSVEYSVYMMGFTPGYPYMGKLDERLKMPRLVSPRQRVPVGSVAIAGLQTGIYSIESPGGWHVIGWTPLTLFDPKRESPFLFAPGDRVRFEPV